MVRMKKRLSGFVAVLLLVLTIVMPSVTYAQCNPDTEVSTSIGCVPNDPAGFSSWIYGVGLSLIGGVALLFLIWGGLLLLTSQGNVGQVAKGKGFIMYAIIGLLLAIFGFVFIQLLLGDILQIPGIS
jgi:hypothetical protein